MAKRRMFSLDIVDTDNFMELPVLSQLLYFHLGTRADDDGFVSNPKKIAKIIGVDIQNLDILIEKNYLIYFESGVVLITHWRLNNYIQKDRYTPTIYTKEFSEIIIENGLYTKCIQNVYTGKYSIGKYSIDKYSINNNINSSINNDISLNNNNLLSINEEYNYNTIPKEDLEYIDNYL